jgi:flagellin
MSSFSQINTNIQAQQAFQNLSDTSEQLADTRERLTTGLRINSASDDAAGFEIAEGLEARTGSQQQALRNIGDAKSALSVAEGGLDSQLNILQSAREKAVQAANGSLSQNERDAIAGELKEQIGEINDIAKNTTFNGDKLIENKSGDSVGLTFQTGSESDQTFDVDIDSSNATDLGVDGSVDATADGKNIFARDFSSSSVSGAINTSSATATKSSLQGVEGGAFDIQVSQTGASTIVVDAEAGGKTKISGTSSSSFDATGASKLTLSSANTTTGDGTSKAKIQLDASKLSISTGAISQEGGTKEFGVEVRDSADIGSRLEGAGADEAREIINDVDSAINGLTSQLSDLGASQNRLSFKESNLETSQTNLEAAQSRIQDADFAKEQTKAAKLQVQQQSGTAQLAQANAAGQSVLSLLQ